MGTQPFGGLFCILKFLVPEAFPDVIMKESKVAEGAQIVGSAPAVIAGTPAFYGGRMKEEMDYIALLLERYPLLTAIESEIRSAYQVLEASYEKGGKLLVGGNGGSSADSEHLVGELMKGFVKRRMIPASVSEALRALDSERGEKLVNGLQGALPAIAVTGHHALTSAFGNDVDWRMAIAQQVYGYGAPGDVFLAISTSGNAENLLYAADVARAKGIRVIALTGKSGGKLASIADVALIVPLQETYQIQELHLPIYHSLCLQLEEHFFD